MTDRQAHTLRVLRLQVKVEGKLDPIVDPLRGAPMAVEVQIDCHGVTLEQYDAAMEVGGFLPGGPLPPAGLFHYVRGTDHGIRVVVVWESMSEFEDFAANRLAPLLEEIGVPLSSLEIQSFELHNYLAGIRYGRNG